jgi:putative endonuclease
VPYYVYILANQRNGTLYTGVTNELARRITEHREERGARFTSRYGTRRLVYVEPHDDVREAIAREKRIKRWKRAWKLELIEKDNPDWSDLFEDLNS